MNGPLPNLPPQKLIAFSVAKDLLLAVRNCHIRDARLRDEAHPRGFWRKTCEPALFTEWLG